MRHAGRLGIRLLHRSHQPPTGSQQNAQHQCVLAWPFWRISAPGHARRISQLRVFRHQACLRHPHLPVLPKNRRRAPRRRRLRRLTRHVRVHPARPHRGASCRFLSHFGPQSRPEGSAKETDARSAGDGGEGPG